jgi:hypothetical protein
VSVVSHHLIQFTRDCARGAGEASFYAADRQRNGGDPQAGSLRPIASSSVPK